jgi:hypothetical protein
MCLFRRKCAEGFGVFLLWMRELDQFSFARESPRNVSVKQSRRLVVTKHRKADLHHGKCHPKSWSCSSTNGLLDGRKLSGLVKDMQLKSLAGTQLLGKLRVLQRQSYNQFRRSVSEELGVMIYARHPSWLHSRISSLFQSATP